MAGSINVTSAQAVADCVVRQPLACRSPTATPVTSGGRGRTARRGQTGDGVCRFNTDGATGIPVNDLTGNDLDSRSAFAGKGQLLWTPSRSWETRLIVNGERDRDGDYALSDLGGLRRNPYHTARDFEGFTHRDIFATTILNRHESQRMTFSATTGFLNWKTVDADRSRLHAAAARHARQPRRELSIHPGSARRIVGQRSGSILGRCQLQVAGGRVFLHAELRSGLRRGTLRRGFCRRSFRLPVTPDVPGGRARRRRRRPLRAGCRDAGRSSGSDRRPAVRSRAERRGAQRLLHASHRAGAADRRRRGLFERVPAVCRGVSFPAGRGASTASVANGYKAGGFNAASPPGTEVYGEEHTWNFEGGLKTTWANGRVAANAAVFHIDWDDMQLNLPNLFVPGEFYIANVGRSDELGGRARGQRPRPPERRCLWRRRLYARPSSRTTASRAACPWEVTTVPNTPDYTASLGIQLSRNLAQGISLYGRAEATFSGRLRVRRPQHASGRTRTRWPTSEAGVRGRLVFVGGVDPECLRHAVHPGGVRVRPAGAVGLHRRDGQAEDLRHYRGSGLLTYPDDEPS